MQNSADCAYGEPAGWNWKSDAFYCLIEK